MNGLIKTQWLDSNLNEIKTGIKREVFTLGLAFLICKQLDEIESQ
jgi:hypothetical protein